MQQHLGRLVGVDKVEVNLADGKVAVYMKEDSQVDPARVFKATYDSGVSVVEMTMDALGWLERDAKNALVFRVSSAQRFVARANDLTKPFDEEREPAKVFVRALLYKKAGKQKPKSLGPVQLEILEVRRQP